jgi:hypothetical protein
LNEDSSEKNGGLLVAHSAGEKQAPWSHAGPAAGCSSTISSTVARLNLIVIAAVFPLKGKPCPVGGRWRVGASIEAGIIGTPGARRVLRPALGEGDFRAVRSARRHAVSEVPFWALWEVGSQGLAIRCQ